MVSKPQTTIPVPPPPPPPPPPPVHLETIYEESSSSLSSSVVDLHHQTHNRSQPSTYHQNQTVHGLISARSIPSVDAHRQRHIPDQPDKPPIEVRHRDGTKHFIHPTFNPTSMIMHRRKCGHPSRHDSSLSTQTTTKTNGKYRQILNPTSKKKKKLPKKSGPVLTIITAEDLSQAGITTPSTSSPDESDTLALTKSISNSSLDTIKTVNDMSLKDNLEVSSERLPTATIPPSAHPIQPVIDMSMSNLRFPVAPRHHSQHQPQLRHPPQMPSIRSQSLPPSQAQFLPPSQQKSLPNPIPPVAVVPPSQKKALPSLQITLTSKENEKKLASKVKPSQTKTSTMKSTNETKNSESKPPFPASQTGLVGGGSRSAFRPFHKSTNLHLQTELPLNMTNKSYFTTNALTQKSSRQQVIQPSYHHPQQYRPTTTSKSIRYTVQPTVPSTVGQARRSTSSDAPRKVINPILSDTVIRSTSKPQLSKYPQQSATISTAKFDRSAEQHSDNTSHPITVDHSIQWHSVTSKSLYDVPRLVNQYSDIPLRITIPNGTPTHNQKLLQKHNLALEQRLLDAGLSPETIALYERILEVADVQQLSPPEIIDPYPSRAKL